MLEMLCFRVNFGRQKLLKHIIWIYFPVFLDFLDFRDLRNLSRSIGLVAQMLLHQKSAHSASFNAISCQCFVSG